MNKDQQAEQLGIFLCDYATTLLECGAATVRIEKNVGRMAEAYGCNAEVHIYPRHIDVVLSNVHEGRTAIRSKAIKGSGINFSTVSALSKLSWNCLDRHMPLDIAERQYRCITETARIPLPAVTLLTALANASFCRLFDGDRTAMAVVFTATACGFYMKETLCRKFSIDIRIATIIAGCVSAIMSCSCYVFNIGTTPDIALATSVLYLIPGIPYLNAVSDLINGHHICAMSRLIHAVTMTVCLSAGLYIGLTLMDYCAK
ncbi:MAG: threonine/serine exporter family protein [Bacteroidales bacterium]|nr:threonine/serine exporter family protein [Bacteroidales bacterium]MCM1147761.1 threonine/serine exporter family protein [Bacteroidales bacterium]MCM1206629.1 threonine/serine exporter family protein [Bacillota bacterium]MCM1510630.1 threonine/serine exporter family protein [Clostridium sp.]